MKNIVFKLLHYLQFYFLIKNNQKNLFICDIDNTIADTWRFIPTNGMKISNTIYSKLPIFPSFTIILNEKFANTECKVLFFTVRPISSWLTTLRWLKKNNFPSRLCDIYLFATPGHKIDFLSSISNLGYNITFLDDLSYNHENGDVKFFIEEINRIKNINVTYVNSESILKIQNEL
jgi:hypothetical protein